MMHAAVAITANIAESSARKTNKDYTRFLAIAMGSVFEIETQPMISQDLNLLDSESYSILQDKLGAITRQMRALKNSLIQHPILYVG